MGGIALKNANRLALRRPFSCRHSTRSGPDANPPMATSTTWSATRSAEGWAVGGVVLQSGAPVADGGAVVGHLAAAALALVVVVEVGPLRSFGLVGGGLAVQ